MKRTTLSNAHHWMLLLLTFNFGLLTVEAQEFVYGDPLPDAPELAFRGPYSVGVKTMQFENPNQVDILNSTGEKTVTYNRPLTTEVWYPVNKQGNRTITEYQDYMGTANDSLRPLIPFTFKGRALRDAVPEKPLEKYPLVIVSHGYVGSRYLMTYLTENLASKGYVVVAIAHTDSTFEDANAFYSTLLNRPLDIKFVLNAIEAISKKGSNTVLENLVDTNNTALIGYSMGGYGVLNVAGGGYSDGLGAFFKTMTKGNDAITVNLASNATYQNNKDNRIKAVVALAPWGKERGVWTADNLKGIKVPTFFIAGDQDDISGYENGIKAIYEEAIYSDRYLLTYASARHNVAPNPAPKEALNLALHFDEYYRYAEPAWDSRRINNINQHFITAFLGLHLKDENNDAFLDLETTENKTNWKGFKPRSVTGLELLHQKPAE